MPRGRTPACVNHKTHWKGPQLYHGAEYRKPEGNGEPWWDRTTDPLIKRSDPMNTTEDHGDSTPRNPDPLEER